MTIQGLIKEAYFKDEPKAPIEGGEMQKIAKALNRVASLPYNEQAHDAVVGIMKIAADAFDQMVSKTEKLEKLSNIRVLVDEMLERGLIDKGDVQIKTAALLKKTERELEIVKEAMELAGSNLQTGGIFDSDPAMSSTLKREMFQSIDF